MVVSEEPTYDVLRGLLAAAPDALLAVNADGAIVFANDQAERLFRWPRADLVGHPVEVLVPPPCRGRHPLLGGGHSARPTTRPMGADLELRARRRDGSEFPARISLRGFETSDGPLVAAAIRDVSERVEVAADRRPRAVEAQAEQSHRLESLGQLAGGVAHDFNNLLGVILNFSTLLARRISDPSLAADVGEIQAAAERAAGLTRQLLTFARRDASHPEAVEVSHVVRGVASMLDRTLGEHIHLELDLGAEPIVAVADRHQLEQIVLNLAVNARDAMPHGGRLTIAMEARPDGSRREVVLRVTDTGHGMPPEVVARAFEP
ncbi:MAG TPA: PAS domain S-box protein, partial [Actinomycetes bacterium]|nr:PAS domain S-box protein [Actinomycetes bacterium]